MELICKYLTGQHFRHRIDAIAESRRSHPASVEGLHTSDFGGDNVHDGALLFDRRQMLLQQRGIGPWADQDSNLAAGKARWPILENAECR